MILTKFLSLGVHQASVECCDDRLARDLIKIGLRCSMGAYIHETYLARLGTKPKELTKAEGKQWHYNDFGFHRKRPRCGNRGL